MCFTSHPLYPIDVATGINNLCQSVLSVGHDFSHRFLRFRRYCNGINNLLNLRHPRDMISHAAFADAHRYCNGIIFCVNLCYPWDIKSGVVISVLKNSKYIGIETKECCV